MARQYALFNPDAPQAQEFEQLAEKYLANIKTIYAPKLPGMPLVMRSRELSAL